MKALGTEHVFSVSRRGFFKRRTAHKDKLFRCTITRYFILQFGAFCFVVGQFFLGRFLSISEYFNLVFQESDSFRKDGIGLNTGKNVEGCFSGSVNSGNIHNKADFDESKSDSNQNGNLGQ